jgi:hypothetical protein
MIRFEEVPDRSPGLGILCLPRPNVTLDWGLFSLPEYINFRDNGII